jgi:phosphatidate cytidylyltransferase
MNLLKRIIVAIIFIPTLLYVYYTGGIVLIGFLSLLSVLCTYEIIKMYEKNNLKILFFNMVFSFGLFYCIASDMLNLAMTIMFFVLVLNGAMNVFFNQIEGSAFRLSGALLSVVYPALCFGLLYRLSSSLDYMIPILAILIWINDSFAYFVGMTLGKHRGVFLCSPKKSVEGFVAGIVFAFVGSYCVMLIFPDVYTWKHVCMLAISTGIFGQFGDLFESVIKRDMGVKDSSKLIPGHGGVLDRFDSLLIAAPVLYVMMKIFG